MIKMENICYSYKSKYQVVEAVKNVSCVFEKGLMYAITGRSGSGKSTLLSLLAGLDLPTSGNIFIDGKNIRTMNRDNYRMNMVSMVYQAFHLFPLLTVLENVMFPMEIKKTPQKEARKKAEDILAQVGLGQKYYHKFPNMLSGGEQQRVALARAAVSEGEILLADEPTGNLDSENEKIIVDILKKLAHEKQFAVIVVTHNEAVAKEADIVMEMLDGKLSGVKDGNKK